MVNIIIGYIIAISCELPALTLLQDSQGGNARWTVFEEFKYDVISKNVSFLGRLARSGSAFCHSVYQC
jgi:hypothetical protein